MSDPEQIVESWVEGYALRYGDLCEVCRENVVAEGEDVCSACRDELEPRDDSSPAKRPK